MLLATRQTYQIRPLVLNLSLKASHVEEVREHRHLGIIIDDEFSRRLHITSTCKYEKNLHLLSRLKHFVDTSKRKLFYHAHISPHLIYASTVWDRRGDILYHTLNSLHRKAAKLMSSLVCWCLSPVNNKGFHQDWKQTSIHLQVIHCKVDDARFIANNRC